MLQKQPIFDGYVVVQNKLQLIEMVQNTLFAVRGNSLTTVFRVQLKV